MNIRIISDSCCDLKEDFDLVQGVDYSSVPLKITVGSQDFVDDPSLDIDQLLEAMRKNAGPSSTACPSPEDYAREFRKSEASVAVTLSSKLSGSYNSAMIAKDMVMEEDPSKRIHVVDSLAASSTESLLVLKLREYIMAGEHTFESIVEKIEQYRDSLTLRFVIQSFDNLIKAGRMSKLAGVFAHALSIRPIAGDNGKGEIKIYEKVRGARNALVRLVEMIGEQLPQGNPVMISHCNNPEDANFIKEALQRLYKPGEVLVLKMRGLSSYYASDKGIIVSF